jgi:hypothetical protein
MRSLLSRLDYPGAVRFMAETDLNPLIPHPGEVILMLVVVGLLMALVIGLVIFVAFRRSAPRKQTHQREGEQPEQHV